MNGKSVSRAQVGKIQATLAGLGITSRPERLRVLAALVYHPVTTTNGLTVNEGSWCIDILTAAAQRDDPRAYIDELVMVAEQRMPSLAGGTETSA